MQTMTSGLLYYELRSINQPGPLVHQVSIAMYSVFQMTSRLDLYAKSFSEAVKQDYKQQIVHEEPKNAWTLETWWSQCVSNLCSNSFEHINMWA